MSLKVKSDKGIQEKNVLGISGYTGEKRHWESKRKNMLMRMESIDHDRSHQVK